MEYISSLSNGKFLRKIIGWGRGTDEISGMFFAHFYDENNDLLYIDDENLNKKLLVYDLNLEKFVAPIKKAIQGAWGSFAIYNDSLIIARSPSYVAEPYAVFFQTFDGRFVSGIPNVKKLLLGSNPVPTFQNSLISIAKNDFLISFELDDTLFTLKNNQLVPYIILDFKNPRERPPNAKVQNGDRGISFPRIEASGFLIIGVSVIDEITWVTQNSGTSKETRKYFFFNKSSGKFALIRTYKDDFAGVIQSPNEDMKNLGRVKFPEFLKNGKLIVVYQPSMIKKIAEQGLIDSIFKPDLRQDFLNVSKNLLETDNPVLLIGKTKEKI
jgi:hypothetical protein